MISRDEIENIIESTDVVSLVSEYVTLEKAGKNYRGLCPFHNEKTPSFFVSPEKKLAHCFSCGKGGSPVQFLMDIKQISFIDALGILADRNGIKVDIKLKDKKDEKNAKYYEINSTAQKFYSHNLLSTESGVKALEYLTKRGINEDIIKTFGIGLSSNKQDLLYNVLKDSNYIELDMIDLGLVKSKDKGYYDLFTKRIMFPILDENSKVLGFSGRVYQDIDKDQPKYVNSPETVLFKKGQVLYNIDKAISSILRNKRVILHEGFMDVIASYKAGLYETVCSMGTALTSNQALLIKKYTDNAIICYDGDSAGVKASLKAIEIFQNVGIDVHLILLPDNMDPDEYILKYGKEEYLKFFNENLIDSIEYSYLQATKEKKFKDYNEIEKVKNFMFKVISHAKSQVIVEKYLIKLADTFKVSEASLYIDYSNYIGTNNSIKNSENNLMYQSVNDSLSIQKIDILRHKKAELRIFNYAKVSKEKALYIEKTIDLDSFEDRNRNLWFHIIDNYYQKFDTFNENEFINSLISDEEKYRCYIGNIEALNKAINEPYSDADLEACIKFMNIEKARIEGLRLSTLNLNLTDEEKIQIAIKKFGLQKDYHLNKKRK